MLCVVSPSGHPTDRAAGRAIDRHRDASSRRPARSDDGRTLTGRTARNWWVRDDVTAACCDRQQDVHPHCVAAPPFIIHRRKGADDGEPVDRLCIAVTASAAAAATSPAGQIGVGWHACRTSEYKPECRWHRLTINQPSDGRNWRR